MLRQPRDLAYLQPAEQDRRVLLHTGAVRKGNRIISIGRKHSSQSVVNRYSAGEPC